MLISKRFSSLLMGLFTLGLGLLTTPAWSQDYISQQALADLQNSGFERLEDVPVAFYDYYIVADQSALRAKIRLWQRVGGKQHKPLIQLLNRSTLEDLAYGDTVVVPTTFVRDLRAYSPFPRDYPGAREFDKIVILDKSIQAFGAYEFGRLVRWGIINTGDRSHRTPKGRFNFNWQQEYRVSTMSPPGEPWEMYWVMNFHEGRGLHIHQFAMPTGGPASHGCVRLLDADAEWLYNWADTWRKTGGFMSSQSGRLLEQGTTLLIIGEDPIDKPRPFLFFDEFPVPKVVELPADPYDVPPGSPQQKKFDRQRILNQR